LPQIRLVYGTETAGVARDIVAQLRVAIGLEQASAPEVQTPRRLHLIVGEST
jgi:hypothetical protein